MPPLINYKRKIIFKKAFCTPSQNACYKNTKKNDRFYFSSLSPKKVPLACFLTSKLVENGTLVV